MENNVSAIILASGLSERMGEPKALLKWNGTTTFLEKIINEFVHAGCSKIICTLNRKIENSCSKFNVPNMVKFVMNEHPEWGRFHSLTIASQEAIVSDFCFIQNVDNPFVNAEIIEKIYTQRSFDAWCSPIYNGKGGHPVLLPQIIIQKIVQAQNNYLTLLDILKPYQRINVEINSDVILRNINTPEDYATYFPKSTLLKP